MEYLLNRRFLFLTTDGIRFLSPQYRYRSSFKFAEDKSTAEESVYFKKQEEEILSRMLKKDPSLDPRYSVQTYELDIYKDISLALSKFGINDPPLSLMEELVLVFTNNGYKKDV